MYEICNPPPLCAEHLSDARLFATRENLITEIVPRFANAIAEVGVALGDFSAFLIETLKPINFVAFDAFDMHESPEHWGRSSKEMFQGLSHEEYYRRRFLGSQTKVVMEKGLSSERMKLYPPCSFDLVYIDAGHTYESVKSDIALATKLSTATGILVFNDYVMFDPFLRTPYGVVQAVNELVIGGKWVIIGFALQRHMFCDVALVRRARPI